MKICRTFFYENLYAIFSIHSQHTQKHAPSVVETEHLKGAKNVSILILEYQLMQKTNHRSARALFKTMLPFCFPHRSNLHNIEGCAMVDGL